MSECVHLGEEAGSDQNVLEQWHFRSFGDPIHHDHSKSKSMPKWMQNLFIECLLTYVLQL